MVDRFISYDGVHVGKQVVHLSGAAGGGTAGVGHDVPVSFGVQNAGCFHTTLYVQVGYSTISMLGGFDIGALRSQMSW